MQIRQRRHQDFDDLIGALVRSGGAEEPLTDQEIISTCIHLMTAGHETTTNFISKAILALLSHPEALRELRHDPNLISAAVEELIRYDSPVQMISRWAYRDDFVGGRAISQGSKVTLVLGSANRDPSRYAFPDTLDFKRRSARHLGFGGGIHYCLGAGLARLEGEIGLLTLINGAPGLSVTSDRVPYADDLVFHGPAQVLVSLGSTS
jgi:cytochrome P450